MQPPKSLLQHKFDKLFEINYDKRVQIFDSDLWEGRMPTRLMRNTIKKTLSLGKKKKGQPKIFYPEEGREKISQQTQMNTRTIIKNPITYPYCCIGMVRGEVQGQVFHGTGFLVAPRIVLTAAHNLYDRHGKKQVSNIKFLPAIVEKRQAIVVQCKNVFYPEEYQKITEIKEVWRYDFGMIELEQDLQKECGYLGIDFREKNLSKVSQIQVCGYDDKNLETDSSSSIKENDHLIFYEASISPGQGGSPIIKRVRGKEYVAGIHIGFEESVNIGVRMTQFVKKILNKNSRQNIVQLNFNGQEMKKWQMIYLAKKSSEFNIVSLYLSCTTISSFELAQLQKNVFAKVKKLRLDNNKIDDKGMHPLVQAFPSVEQLTLSDNKITGEGVKNLCLNIKSNLRVLDISSNSLGNKTMKFLQEVSFLITLNLENTQITSEGLQILSQIRFPYLRFFGLGNNKITDAGMKFLHQFQILENLYLENTQLTGRGLKVLSEGNFPFLKILSINQNHVGDEEMVYLHSFKNIEGIHMESTQITEKSLKILSQGKLPYLQVLGIKNNKVKDQGIKFLQKFPSLKTVDLSNNLITLKGVQILSEIKLPQLSNLMLWKNNIQGQGSKIVQKVREEKNIRVYYDALFDALFDQY